MLVAAVGQVISLLPSKAHAIGKRVIRGFASESLEFPQNLRLNMTDLSGIRYAVPLLIVALGMVLAPAFAPDVRRRLIANDALCIGYAVTAFGLAMAGVAVMVVTQGS